MKIPRTRGLVSICLVCLLVPESALALKWDRLWLNNDQRGADKMERKQYASAAETFDNEHWKAAALYKAGEYQSAVEIWERMEDIEAHYNRGNALARSGDLQAAIAAYETVLNRDPEHADARYNLELLKKMMDDQPESSNRDEQKEQDDANENEQDAQQQQSQQGQSNEQEDQRESERTGESPESDQSKQVSQQPRPEQQETDRSEEKQRRQSMQQKREEKAQAPETPNRMPETESPERQAAMEQWLRRIPDDPGGLLRRKFLYQYSSRHRRKERVEEPW